MDWIPGLAQIVRAGWFKSRKGYELRSLLAAREVQAVPTDAGRRYLNDQSVDDFVRPTIRRQLSAPPLGRRPRRELGTRRNA